MMKYSSNGNKKAKKTLDLTTFLENCKVDKGCEHTHTSMGKPMVGSFFIPDEQMDIFFNLYQKEYDSGKKLCIIEKHKEVGPMIIDLDLKYEIEYQLDANGIPLLNDTNEKIVKLDRKYSEDLIKQIVKLYMNEIDETFDLPANNSDKKIAMVFERPKPYCFKDEIKDGVHIMFPYIISDPNVQYLIREKVIKNAANLFDNIPLKNKVLPEIFDRSVIHKNGWFMYGSSKPYCGAYTLTNIYDANLSKLKITELDLQGITNLAKFLSIRRYHVIECTKVKTLVQDGIDKILKKQKTYTQNKLTKTGPSNANYDIKTIAKLVDILSEQRADNYGTWMEVGWCLHNIDPTNVDLLHIWTDFSRRSKKFKEGRCENEWMKFKNDGLTIGSLHHWAKTDNHDAYMEIKRDDIQFYIEKSINTTNYDIAKVLYSMYRGHFICASFKNNIWYEFKDHRWKEIDSGVELRKKISNDLVDEYCRLMSKYNILGSMNENEMDPEHKYTEDEQEEFLEKSRTLHKITLNIKSSSFKNNVLMECREIFYEKDFINKLDSNPWLIGFNNGVYDLKKYEFRDGRPEDYISFSTLNDYKEFEENDPLMEQMKTFISQAFVDKDMREYMLTMLASCLQGVNNEEKFRVWTGCHAKDTLIMLADGSTKKVQEITTEDELMGDDSKPRKVLQLIQNRAKMYRIVPIKGEPYVINGDHIMCLKATNTISLSKPNGKNIIYAKWMELDENGYPFRCTQSFCFNSQSRIVKKSGCHYYDTREEALEEAEKFLEIIKHADTTIKYGDVIEIPLVKYMEISKKIGERNFFAYRVGLDFPKQDVELDPYILGYWLGDGHSAGPTITTMEPEVLEYFETTMKAHGLQPVLYANKGKANTFGYTKIDNTRNMHFKNPFMESLKKYDLINNKHIPDIYLKNDRETRLKVLAGLMDSDGGYEKHVNQYSITLKSEKLFDGIVFLCRSLGFACYKKAIKKTCTNNGVVGDYFTMQIVGNGIEDIPVLCPRKKAVARNKTKDPLVYSFSVEELEVDDYYGFVLSGNRRYVMGDFTVTHNTGSNSKSKCAELMQLAFGEYCIKFPITLLTQKRGKSSAASPEVVDGKGKRFGIFEEPDEDERINVGLMKEYSGNDKIKGRGLFEKFIEFKPQWKLHLLCNDLPEMPPHDKGTWRRVEAIEFQSRFVDNPDPNKPNEFPRDYHLMEKLATWKEAFMCLLLQYYKKYIKYGIKVPPQVVAFTKKYSQESDKYAEFIEEYLIETGNPKDQVDLDEIYAEFKFWHSSVDSGNKVPAKRDIKRYFEKALGRQNVTLTKIRGFKKSMKDKLVSENGPEQDDLEGSLFSQAKKPDVEVEKHDDDGGDDNDDDLDDKKATVAEPIIKKIKINKT